MTIRLRCVFMFSCYCVYTYSYIITSRIASSDGTRKLWMPAIRPSTRVQRRAQATTAPIASSRRRRATTASTTVDLPQVSLEWVLIGYIQFIMRSVLNLKRRTRETCKTRHSLPSFATKLKRSNQKRNKI